MLLLGGVEGTDAVHAINLLPSASKTKELASWNFLGWCLDTIISYQTSTQIHRSKTILRHQAIVPKNTIVYCYKYLLYVDLNKQIFINDLILREKGLAQKSWQLHRTKKRVAAEVGQDKNRVVGEGLGHLFLMLVTYLKIRWITECIFGQNADCLGALDEVPLGCRCMKFPPYT